MALPQESVSLAARRKNFTTSWLLPLLPSPNYPAPYDLQGTFTVIISFAPQTCREARQKLLAHFTDEKTKPPRSSTVVKVKLESKPV